MTNSFFTLKTSVKMLFISMLALMVACGPAQKGDGPIDDELLETSGYINISSTVPQNPTDQGPEGLAKFAWEEFLALNWQASWGQNNPDAAKRGIADPNWTGTESYGDNYQVVWETYAHVTEMRPGSNNMLPFDDPPHYSYLDFLYRDAAATTGLDSTLFNNLDEDTEIGSCNVFPPNTYDGNGNPTELVLYQAKANREEYDYVLNNYPDSSALKTAAANTASNIKNYRAYYEGGTSSCNCPESAGVICLPCGGAANPAGGTYEGAIEVKTAWRRMQESDDPNTIFIRNNIYYHTNEDGKLVYNNGRFALIGVHVIHKTVDFQEFIFASWEHNSVETTSGPDSNRYQLQLLTTSSPASPETYERYSPVPGYLDSVTAQVHQQIEQSFGGLNVWTNYRLIGVQGTPIDYADRDSDPNYFMANYVIESDTIGYASINGQTVARPGLANFHGFGFSFIDTSSVDFKNDINTLDVSENKFLDMGGCQGCHGVGQTFLGTDFSFLLDSGFGKPVARPAANNTITLPKKTQIKRFLHTASK